MSNEELAQNPQQDLDEEASCELDTLQSRSLKEDDISAKINSAELLIFASRLKIEMWIILHMLPKPRILE